MTMDEFLSLDPAQYFGIFARYQVISNYEICNPRKLKKGTGQSYPFNMRSNARKMISILRIL